MGIRATRSPEREPPPGLRVYSHLFYGYPGDANHWSASGFDDVGALRPTDGSTWVVRPRFVICWSL